MKSRALIFQEIAALCFFILLFVAASFFAAKYGDYLQDLMKGRGLFPLLIYFLFVVAAEVVAPISALPALPLAVSIWGSLLTAIVSWAGWLIGSLIAFGLARRFGERVVGRLINLDRVRNVSRFIPEKNLFWIIIFLRFFFPADIFSYALGLFTQINWRLFFWSSFIGLAPFSLIFSYGVKIPIQYQIIMGLAAVFITLVFYRGARQKISRWLKSVPDNS